MSHCWSEPIADTPVTNRDSWPSAKAMRAAAVHFLCAASAYPDYLGEGHESQRGAYI